MLFSVVQSVSRGMATPQLQEGNSFLTSAMAGAGTPLPSFPSFPTFFDARV